MAAGELVFGTIGIGGYAASYLSSLDYLAEQGTGRLAAAVVRSPKKYADRLPDLEKKGVKIYPDLASMLETEKLDVVGVPTGISSHVPLTIQAMRAGCDVVCEKPLCATVQEAAELVAERVIEPGEASPSATSACSARVPRRSSGASSPGRSGPSSAPA